MSSGGSTGLPATPAPTPFSHGPGGVRPEDLAASISRLSVIQEADTGPAINILDASANSGSEAAVSPAQASNPNNLSNYFGTPQTSGDSIFDQLSASPRSRATSESQPQPPSQPPSDQGTPEAGSGSNQAILALLLAALPHPRCRLAPSWGSTG